MFAGLFTSKGVYTPATVHPNIESHAVEDSKQLEHPVGAHLRTHPTTVDHGEWRFDQAKASGCLWFLQAAFVKVKTSMLQDVLGEDDRADVLGHRHDTNTNDPRSTTSPTFSLPSPPPCTDDCPKAFASQAARSYRGFFGASHHRGCTG